MLKSLATFIFSAAGWKIVGQPAPVDKCVIVVAYHTSNWDALPCLCSNVITGLYVSWMGKASIFRWPLGGFLLRVGGVPIHRERRENFVGDMVEQFRSKPRFVLAVAPEGTRKRVSKWKTGFYYIARNAGVPLQPAALDYKNKCIVFGPPIPTTQDGQADIAKLREFFRQYEPKRPEFTDKDFSVDI